MSVELPTREPGVLIERPANGVLRLTLNRPKRRNALTAELAAELRAAVGAARSDPGVRAVIVTGAGAAFCAGADLGALTAAAKTVTARQELLGDYYRAFLDLRDLPMPTLAAVNGAAVGAGLNLALCCDLRILSGDAKLAAPFVKLGIHPGGGCSWMLSRIAGPAAARELLFLGDPVSAPRALELGLASRVVAAEELAETALRVGTSIAAMPRAVMLNLKRSLSLAEGGSSFEATLSFESRAQAESMGTADAREGWTAFRERRQPHFGNR